MEFGVWGLGFRVLGLGFGVWGLRFGVCIGVWSLGCGVLDNEVIGDLRVCPQERSMTKISRGLRGGRVLKLPIIFFSLSLGKHPYMMHTKISRGLRGDRVLRLPLIFFSLSMGKHP